MEKEGIENLILSILWRQERQSNTVSNLHNEFVLMDDETGNGTDNKKTNINKKYEV